MNFEEWKAELDARLHQNPDIQRSWYLQQTKNVSNVVIRANQCIYLRNKDRALLMLQQAHGYLAKQYARWLQASSTNKAPLEVFSTHLALLKSALVLVTENIRAVKEDDLVDLFCEGPENTLLIDAADLNACWNADPSFDCLRYLSQITNNTRHQVVEILRAYRAQQENKGKENA
jgi:hypothetical protein